MVVHPGMQFWSCSNNLHLVSIGSVVNKFKHKFAAEGKPWYGYSILLPMIYSLPCVHLRHRNKEWVDTVRPMFSSPSIFNKYRGITKFVVVINLMMVPIMVQKRLTIEKLICRRSTKNLEFQTYRVIIYLCQGRVSQHNYCCIVWLFMTINTEN